VSRAAAILKLSLSHGPYIAELRIMVKNGASEARDISP